MVYGRRGFYSLLILSVIMLPAAGCGKPAPPPPGAPSDAAAPSVDLGTPSGPQDSAAGASDSAPELGTPTGEQGETK